jgi:O-antigen/teichoic acid export membrane protein
MADELIQVAEDSARGGFFLISGTALATVIMAIASILIGRFLGPELYGQYTLALVVPQLLFLFTDLGINQGIIKFTASLRSTGETNRITKIIKHGLILRASTGIAISIINYAFAELFASLFLQRPELALYIKIASISVLFQVIFTTATSAFVGLDKTEYNALTANIQATAKAIISIALVLLGFSVVGAIIGYVAGYVVAAIASISILFLLIRGKQSNQNKNSISDDMKTLVRYGAPLYISLLLSGFIPLYQNVMLAIFTADIDIGNYKAATNFIALMAILAVPITTALLPAFSKLNSSTNQKIKTFYTLANKYTAMIIIPITFLIIIFSKEIVEIIYGYTYQSAPVFLTTYCLLYFLVGLGYLVLPSLYNGLGETKTTLKMSLITFLTLAVLSPIFTKTYSVQGLIVAFLIASTVGTTYGLYIARKDFQIEFDTNILFRIYLNSVISSILPLLMLHFSQLPKILNITIGGLLYLFIYATLTPLTKTVNPSELEAATHIAQKIRLLALIAKPMLTYQQRLLKTFRKSSI